MIAPTPLSLPDCRIPWRHLALDTVTSTNDIALQQAAQGAAEGLVVTARQQSAGRGRHGREWIGDPGRSLLMSLLLRPERIDPHRLPQISLAAALALHDALSAAGANARVKWPNDLLIEGCKVAGILSELRCAPTGGPIVAVGIGLNLKPPVDGWPGHLRRPAAALSRFAGVVQCDAAAWMLRILPCFDRRYAQLTDDAFPAIADDWWRAHGGARPVTVDEECALPWRGTAVGIDDDGALLVRDAEGRTHRIVAAEVDG